MEKVISLLDYYLINCDVEELLCLLERDNEHCFLTDEWRFLLQMTIYDKVIPKITLLQGNGIIGEDSSHKKHPVLQLKRNRRKDR